MPKCQNFIHFVLINIITYLFKSKNNIIVEYRYYEYAPLSYEDKKQNSKPKTHLCLCEFGMPVLISTEIDSYW